MTSPAPSPGARRSESPPRTVGEILRWTEGYFREIGIESARLDAELLLAHALGTERLDLYLNFHRPLDGAERDRFRECVKRRSRREPVAYITGSREFWSLPFAVGHAVLIPRPETEHLIEESLAILAALDGVPSRVLDLGTGSGNIAVTLAVQSSTAEVDAVDASTNALSIAQGNARKHGVEGRIRFFAGDLFAPLAGDRLYHLIVSNPPYVRADEIESLSPDIRLHEPREALVDTKSQGSDGLGFYREIASSAPAHLLPNGVVAVEVGAGQAERVAGIFAENGFARVESRLDLAGISRVIVARRESC